MSEYIKLAKASLLLHWDNPEKQISGVSAEEEVDPDSDLDIDPAAMVLADIIDRSGLPRKLGVLAEVATQIQMMNPSLSGIEGVDAAELAFFRAAEAVVDAWEKHDEGRMEFSE